MIANIQDTLKWIEDNGIEHWVVKTSHSDNAKIFETLEDETLEDRKSRFLRVMDYTTGNRFVISGKLKAKAGRGLFTTEFRNQPTQPNPHSTMNGTLPTIEGHISIGELDRRMRENEERIMQKVELERIKDENAFLKEQIAGHDQTMTRIWKRAEPFIAPLLGSIVGKVAPQQELAMAGITEPIDLSEQEAQDRMIVALEKWQEHEPRILELIEKLATMAESQDGMYTMAKNAILKD